MSPYPSSANVFRLADEDIVLGPQYRVGDERGGGKPSSRGLKLARRERGELPRFMHQWSAEACTQHLTSEDTSEQSLQITKLDK